MRQGDGSDLLGPGNPHNSEVGIIHVEPADSRQEVLKAINTQEMTGRKQIAIVLLSDQHKAFRQPVDFDGLKNVRRGLKAQLVFIAQPGPGPANFARQRNFPVFSSLESFKQALLTEGIQAPGNGRAKSKPGLLAFGSRRAQARNQGQQQVTPPMSPRPQQPKQSGKLNQAFPPSPMADLPTTELEQADQPGVGSAVIAAGAAGLMAGALAAQGLEGDDDALYTPPSSQQPGPTPLAPNKQSFSAASPSGDLVRSPDQPVKGPSESRPLSSPGIIAFPGVPATPKMTGKIGKMQNVQSAQPKTSGKLPAVQNPAGTQTPDSGKLPAAQKQNPHVLPPTKPAPPGSGNTGKIAAVAAGAAALGAGAIASGSASPGTGNTIARANAVGAPGAVAGGTGGSGPGPRPSGLTPLPPPRSQAQRRRFWRRTLLLLLLLLLLSAVLGGSVYLSAHGGPAQVFNPTVTASITITPANKLEQDRYVIVGLATGTPNPAERQVAAQILTKESVTQSATGHATGSIEATQAHGTLTFVNSTGSVVTLGSTTLTAKNGAQIRFNGPVDVPAAGTSGPVEAFAVNAGTQGNIGAQDISGPCCAPGIGVRNPSGFTGGRDAIVNSILRKEDIDNAAKPLITSLSTSTQADLQKAVQSNQKIVKGSLKCTPTLESDHQAGEQTKTVKVNVSVTCSEEVYDFQAAKQIATSSLSEKATNDLPDHASQYALVGQIVPEVLSTTVVGTNKQVTIYLQVTGLWAYQFTNQAQQNLKQMLLKHTKKDAQNILLHFLGIAATPPPVITLSSGEILPSEVGDITLTLSPLAGAQATVTPNGSGTPIPIVSPTSVTPTPTTGVGK